MKPGFVRFGTTHGVVNQPLASAMMVRIDHWMTQFFQAFAPSKGVASWVTSNYTQFVNPTRPEPSDHFNKEFQNPWLMGMVIMKWEIACDFDHHKHI